MEIGLYPAPAERTIPRVALTSCYEGEITMLSLSEEDADLIRATERERLRALVDANVGIGTPTSLGRLPTYKPSWRIPIERGVSTIVPSAEILSWS